MERDPVTAFELYGVSAKEGLSDAMMAVRRVCVCVCVYVCMYVCTSEWYECKKGP